MCCICVVIASELLLFRKREAQFQNYSQKEKRAILNIKKVLSEFMQRLCIFFP
jgi:hypothetical protein